MRPSAHPTPSSSLEPAAAAQADSAVGSHTPNLIPMSPWLERLTHWLKPRGPLPEHLRRGRLGEAAARRELERVGLKLLTGNFRSHHGEIDLIFRDRDCLVFVEVKTRSSEDWTRPAAAVNARKRRLLSLTAEDYLRQLPDRRVKWRFDVVEVLLAGGEVQEVRHVVHAFALDPRRPRRR